MALGTDFSPNLPEKGWMEIAFANLMNHLP
jgi:hypothetical protein